MWGSTRNSHCSVTANHGRFPRGVAVSCDLEGDRHGRKALPTKKVIDVKVMILAEAAHFNYAAFHSAPFSVLGFLLYEQYPALWTHSR